MAFITGGASGIGAALATKLAEGGAEVWIADRQVEAAQQLAERLDTGGNRAHAIELDVRGYPSFKHAVVALSKALRVEADRHGVRSDRTCRACASGGIAWGCHHHRAGLVEGALVSGPSLAELVDAERDAIDHADT